MLGRLPIAQIFNRFLFFYYEQQYNIKMTPKFFFSNKNNRIVNLNSYIDEAAPFLRGLMLKNGYDGLALPNKHFEVRNIRSLSKNNILVQFLELVS